MAMTDKCCAYIDGSYNPRRDVYGYGIILFDQHGNKHALQGKDNGRESVKMRNVAGEILGAVMAIRKAIELDMPEITLYYDYEGIEKWITGEWQAKNPMTKAYVYCVTQAMSNHLDVYFEHVKAHSGVEHNEAADWLAKQAVGLI